MNKAGFVKYVAEQNNVTKKEADKIINIFCKNVIGAMGEGKQIHLVGFGSFSIIKMATRKGRNPQTGEVIQIKAYNQPKFKVGKTLKNAVNK